MSYFNVDALLLVWIARVLKGALGYGYYLTAPVLAAIAVIQLGHRGRPVVLRTTCVALLPLLVGVLCHLALCRTAYTLGLDSVIEPIRARVASSFSRKGIMPVAMETT